jgi:hypothetical protein
MRLTTEERNLVENAAQDYRNARRWADDQPNAAAALAAGDAKIREVVDRLGERA